VVRFVLTLLAVLLLAVRPSFAQDEPLHVPPHGPPPRLARPAPAAAPARTSFRLSLAASLRLQALDIGLRDIAPRERKRFLPGSLRLGVGVGLGVAAYFVDDPGMRAAFTLASGVSGLHGILQLAIHSNTAEALAVFASIKPIDRRSMLRKLSVGEHALAHAARVSRKQRILEGCIGALAAAAYVPVQYAFAQQADADYRFGSSAGAYVGLSLSLIGLASSLVQAIMKSPSELLYDEYRALRRAAQRLPTHAPLQGVRLALPPATAQPPLEHHP
jgi:hypothetical protein